VGSIADKNISCPTTYCFVGQKSTGKAVSCGQIPVIFLVAGDRWGRGVPRRAGGGSKNDGTETGFPLAGAIRSLATRSQEPWIIYGSSGLPGTPGAAAGGSGPPLRSGRVQLKAPSPLGGGACSFIYFLGRHPLRC